MARAQPLPQPFLGVCPKPYRGPTALTSEEFAAWASHPVTEWVAARYEAMALACREDWVSRSWASGEATPESLLELRTRADCYMAFLETDWGRYSEIQINPKGNR